MEGLIRGRCSTTRGAKGGGAIPGELPGCVPASPFPVFFRIRRLDSGHFLDALSDHQIDHPIEKGRLVLHVVIEGHRFHTQAAGQVAAWSRSRWVAVRHLDGGAQHPFPVQGLVCGRSSADAVMSVMMVRA
jgi:hypothetical protein